MRCTTPVATKRVCSLLIRRDNVARLSEAHLSAPQIRQILLGRTTLEVDFKVHGGEVWGRPSFEKGLPLFRKIGAILRAVWRGADVDDTGVLGACVFVGNGMADARVPEDCVAGHDLRDAHQPGHQTGMPLRADPERTYMGRAAK